MLYNKLFFKQIESHFQSQALANSNSVAMSIDTDWEKFEKKSKLPVESRDFSVFFQLFYI